MSAVIGEGTYGCVHKPSLKCKSNTVNYKNKISKVLTTKHANVEMKEYNTISNIDKKKHFYLGKPIKCTLDGIHSNINSILKCKNKTELLTDIKKLSLIIMEDGGINLDEFSNELSKMPVNDENKKRMELFWIEAHRILMGINAFLKNGIVHHDLKPQNIVYKMETGRLNFIDFGLMTKKSIIIEKSIKSTNWMGTYHWSFPFELDIYNKQKFVKLFSKSKANKIKYYNEFLKKFKSPDDNNVKNSLKTFFSYVSEPNQSVFLTDYYNTIVNDFTSLSQYDHFLNKSIDTIDIYGAGIAFYDVFLNSKKFFNKSFNAELLDILYLMVTAKLNNRITIHDLINRYEYLLLNSGLLEKHNKHFENHVLKEGPPTDITIQSKIKSIHPEDINISEEEKQKNIMSKLVLCPPEKELNPYLNKCVKKCKKGMSRNDRFKCVKTNKKKSPNNKRQKTAKRQK